MNRFKKDPKPESLRLLLDPECPAFTAKADRLLGWKSLYAALLVCMAVLCFTEAAVSEGMRASVFGTLTSIESDGTVIIDEGGYVLDPSSKVINGHMKRTTLDQFNLPAKVLFEYEFTERGPVIKVITELPQ